MVSQNKIIHSQSELETIWSVRSERHEIVTKPATVVTSERRLDSLPQRLRWSSKSFGSRRQRRLTSACSGGKPISWFQSSSLAYPCIFRITARRCSALVLAKPSQTPRFIHLPHTCGRTVETQSLADRVPKESCRSGENLPERGGQINELYV